MEWRPISINLNSFNSNAPVGRMELDMKKKCNADSFLSDSQVAVEWMASNMEKVCNTHYSDVIMGSMASQITSLTIVYLTVYSASLAFVRWIHRWSVNSPHKWPVTRKMFPFDEVIMSKALVGRLESGMQKKCQAILCLCAHIQTNAHSKSMMPLFL